MQSVIFDLGGVLLDWNPRHLYRKLFNGDEAAMERFLGEICTMAWHLQHDAGRPFAETCAELKREHPGHAALIDAFGERHDEMTAGAIPGTVALLERIADHLGLGQVEPDDGELATPPDIEAVVGRLGSDTARETLTWLIGDCHTGFGRRMATSTA